MHDGAEARRLGLGQCLPPWMGQGPALKQLSAPQLFSYFQTSQTSQICEIFIFLRTSQIYGLGEQCHIWRETHARALFCVREGPDVLHRCSQLARHLPLSGNFVLCLRPGDLAKKEVKRDNGAPNCPLPSSLNCKTPIPLLSKNDQHFCGKPGNSKKVENLAVGGGSGGAGFLGICISDALYSAARQARIFSTLQTDNRTCR